jgi:hypothetical protein
MKTALITTCIRPPRVLELMRGYDPNVKFFVAGDKKSDTAEMREWANGVGNTEYLSPEDQLKYKCSGVIGWHCIQRRNIALLEALRWGAECIISWDDDNLGFNDSYFWEFQKRFRVSFKGFEVSSRQGWVNQYGPNFKHRGFPVDIRLGRQKISAVVNVKVGVVAGLCLGDPDIDAYTRMALAPNIGTVDEISKAGFVVAPECKCVFNTQNTAYLRQFAPAMFCAPGVGRHDDILASLVTQRMMRNVDYRVCTGRPFTHQERNHHDLLIDLKQEMWGMEHLLEVSDFIDKIPADVDVPKYFWTNCKTMPEQAREAGLVFLEDVEQVMQ